MKAILADPAIKEALVSISPTSRQNPDQIAKITSSGDSHTAPKFPPDTRSKGGFAITVAKG
jgi:hypothetical protein